MGFHKNLQKIETNDRNSTYYQHNPSDSVSSVVQWGRHMYSDVCWVDIDGYSHLYHCHSDSLLKYRNSFYEPHCLQTIKVHSEVE